MREPWQDKRPCVANHRVEHKWSVWSSHPEEWESRDGGSGFLRDLRALGVEGERIELVITSQKEIRHGAITIEGEAEEPPDENGSRAPSELKKYGLPGSLRAYGSFSEEWDEPHTLADTLGGDEDDVARAVPRCDNGEPGVTVHFDVRASTVEELLRLIDKEEERLISDSRQAWKEIVRTFRAKSD